ncbi:MAG: TrbI F-type domain-containing protein [Sphingomonas sp.]
MTKPAPVTVDAVPESDTSSSSRLLGFTPRDLAIVAAFLLLSTWAFWATRELLELRDRRIVSVSLSTIIKNFVAAEARNGSSPEQAAARTKAYLAATDAAMQSLSRSGATVLVSEAVVGNSVPDMTGAVANAVQESMAKQPAPAAAPASAGGSDGR